ncbi:MAG: hypothetical protein FJW27_17880 [Acidimicrobiia bacterium]|nr:hypothetical protein [Acidimicrobiia bacterium]
MRLRPVRFSSLFTGLIATVLVAQLPESPWHSHVHAAQQELTPISYVCPMASDAEVVEVKPGKCRLCGMVLEPVRLDTAWSCPNHAVVIKDQKGSCPIDKRELVQVIVAKYWTCGDKPDEKLPDPGKCANGSPRKLNTALRAHGDHNPRYGGSFFMAEDKWHHLEGTYPSAGLFRMYFYDNFTKPMSPKKFSGRVFFEEAGKETASFPMSVSRNGKTLDAQIKGMPTQPSKTTPVKLAARVKFDTKLPEQRFDFVFIDYSKEPLSTPPAPKPTATAAVPAALPARAAAAAVVPPSVPAPPPPPATSEGAPITASASVPQNTSAATLSRTDAAQLVENLPTSPAELLKLLEQRTQEVRQAITEGQYGYVYIPALLSKDIALAIGDQVSQLPDSKQNHANAAVRQLVIAAWDLDFYGDLGNKEKITEAFNSLASAFENIKAAYGSSR